MGKRIVKKTQIKVEEEDDVVEEDEEELSSKDHKEGRGRQDNSLSVLTKKFIDLIKGS